MGFTASKIFWWFSNPSNLLLLAVVLIALSMLFRWRRLGGWLAALAALGVMTIAFTPAREWVLRPLEYRFPTPTLPSHVDGIIVLGGAINSDLSARSGLVSVNDAAERLFTFMELGQRYPKAKMLFTGGSANVLDDGAREADFARILYAKLGFDETRIQFERDSRNTEENARFSKAIVRPASGEVWVLITSAYHMPRAVGVFRALNWPVLPYPVDYGVTRSGGWEVPGLLDGLSGVQWGMKEWIGLVYYRLLGFTEELFPGP